MRIKFLTPPSSVVQIAENYLAFTVFSRFSCPSMSVTVRGQQPQLVGLGVGLEMAQGKNKLTALALKNAPGNVVQDGGGLSLTRTPTGGKWTYRYSIAGRRRDMGIGTYPDVTLAEARRERDKWAAVLVSGL